MIPEKKRSFRKETIESCIIFIEKSKQLSLDNWCPHQDEGLCDVCKKTINIFNENIDFMLIVLKAGISVNKTIAVSDCIMHLCCAFVTDPNTSNTLAETFIEAISKFLYTAKEG